MRRLAFLLTGLALLAGINATVWRFEHAMSQGEVVLIELAPVDPRSLMQGDYMRLNYALARQLAGRQAASGLSGLTPSSSKRAREISMSRPATASFVCRRMAAPCWWG